MKKLLTILLVCVIGCQWSNVTCAERPKLVVGIIIDQMRWDYLERYRDRYCEGGFRRMMNEGYNCNRCMINYMPAVTAVGHASVYTGSVPAFHGIVNNSFRINGKNTSAPYDENMSTVGSTTKVGQRSPHNMMATTIGDELRMFTNFRSKVIGVAIKDRSSVLPAGHSANAAYWLDDSNDRFITSSYYMTKLPKWVEDFNKHNKAKKYMKRDWPKKMMYKEKTYVQSHARDERIETKVGEDIRSTPWGATLTFDMACAAIEGEKLGKDEFTDMLCVSISSTDIIAHRVGCNSPLVEDAYLWLDQDLETFFDFLDSKVGKGQWTAFLTADHAGSHNPQWRMDHKIPAQVWENTQTLKDLNQLVANKTGVADVVMDLNCFKVMLNEPLMREKGLKRNDVADMVVDYLRTQPFVLYAFDVERMPDNIPEPIRTMARNGYYPGRTGQIQIVPTGDIMEAFNYGEGQNRKGASHMLWGPDDTHIPLIFMGKGVTRGENNHTVYITDIAATITALLHIQQPSACVGEPIF